nr:transposase zinc-binding domain-containing protein [Glaciecola sp. MH2013]
MLQVPNKHKYQRHRPEQTLLYQLVECNYPDFQAHLSHQGKSLPHHVEKEFDEFLKCGRLENGFLRVVCGDCKHEKLVAFSCKRRGFYSGHPVLRPLGQPSVVQNRSQRFCAQAAARDEWQKVQLYW